MLQPDAPFYIQPLNESQWNANKIVWFKQQAMGIHSLGTIMRTMSQASNIPGKKTNHSGRKTTIKRLREASVEACDIVQLTGHKNVQSINNYSEVSTKKQKQMSDILVASKAETIIPNITPSSNSSITEPAPKSPPNALIDSELEDDFNNILASIENYEQYAMKTTGNVPASPQTVANNVLFGGTKDPAPPSQYANAVMHGSTMNNCSFNITVNINSK